MLFSGAALRASLRRQIAARHEPGATGVRWSQADLALARAVYAALVLEPDVELELPGGAAGPDGAPEVDWSAITLEELAAGVRGAELRHDAGAAGAGEPKRPRGATVRDAAGSGPEALTYAVFMDERARRRAADAQALRDQRERFREEAALLREQHFAVAQELFADPTMPRAVRAQALRDHRQALRRALAEHARARDEALGVGQPWYATRVERWSAERSDRADYASALKTLYEDRLAAHAAGDPAATAGLDPVLVSIPGARRHREGGTMVYTRRTPAGTREMFRCVPETRDVIVRSADPLATEAALITAYRMDGPPLTFVGSPAFRARCEEIALRHGFETAAAVHPPQQPTPTTMAAHPGGGQPTAEATTRSAAPTAPDLEQYADMVAHVKEQTGVELVLPLDAKHGVPMEPVYLAHTPMADAPFDVVFVQNPGVEAISAIVLATGVVPPDAVFGETRVALEVENGAWVATFDRGGRTPVDEVGPEIRPSRGR